MKYLLLGLGKSNISLSKFFEKKNIDYFWYEDNEEVERAAINKYKYLENRKHTGNVGKYIVVKSGFIPKNHFMLDNARVVISDLELYYLYNNLNKIITVTGTNGKSTCVSMIKHIIEDIALGGNIGIPLGDLFENRQDIVIEASSYMLENVNIFHSKFNVLLNITPNHLDYHLNFENYIAAKMKLFKNCDCGDYIIYNYDDEVSKNEIKKLKTHANVIPISIKSKVNGIYLMNDYVYLYDRPIMHIDEIKVNEVFYISALASILVCYLYGISIYNIRERIKTFNNLKYRLTKTIVDDLIIYNDSKSTNIKSLNEAIQSVLKENKYKRICLICGGQIRENMNYLEELNKINLVSEDIIKVITFGQMKDIMGDYFRKRYPTVKLNKLEDFNYDLIKDCQVVLFSPGNPSHDEFNNYKLRGEMFDKKIKKS